MAMFKQLGKLDFTDKTINLIITHEGSLLGNTIKDIENSCNGAIIQKRLAIKGSEVNDSKRIIKDWLND